MSCPKLSGRVVLPKVDDDMPHQRRTTMSPSPKVMTTCHVRRHPIVCAIQQP